MATSEDLLGIRPVVTATEGPSPKDVLRPSLERAAAQASEAPRRKPRLSLGDLLPSWTAAKA